MLLWFYTRSTYIHKRLSITQYIWRERLHYKTAAFWLLKHTRRKTCTSHFRRVSWLERTSHSQHNIVLFSSLFLLFSCLSQASITSTRSSSSTSENFTWLHLHPYSPSLGCILVVSWFACCCCCNEEKICCQKSVFHLPHSTENKSSASILYMATLKWKKDPNNLKATRMKCFVQKIRLSWEDEQYT